jgi:uracil-DNA glycosylase family 4
MKGKKDDLKCFFSTVRDCNKCPRMYNRKKVLSFENGNIHSKVVFIAEAPGRLGAEQTGKPLHGDKTGNNFESLIKEIGWNREDVFITNAGLCNPQDEEGNNSKPEVEEIRNCSIYLQKTLELIKPEIIVTLGVTALKALKYIENHDFVLRDYVSQKLSWNKMSLFPLYHPSPKAIKHRTRDRQKSDFRMLSDIVDPIKGIK